MTAQQNTKRPCPLSSTEPFFDLPPNQEKPIEHRLSAQLYSSACGLVSIQKLHALRNKKPVPFALAISHLDAMMAPSSLTTTPNYI